MLISINALSLAPAPLTQQIETVARTGLRGIGLEIDQVNVLGVPATRSAVRDAGLRISTLTHRAFGFATPEATRAARDRLFGTIESAKEIGAEAVIMITGGRGALSWSEAAERFAEAMAPCAEAARASGLRIGIEPTSHLYADSSIAHRLSDTIAVARMAGIDVIIDLFACWFDADIDEAIAKAKSSIALVQVSDYVHGDRALPCRAVPGDGMIPLDRLLRAVDATGFSGWYDLEVIGPRLQAEGEEAGLRRAADHVGRILARGER